ncbi:hypothetical protein C8Q80DRAFT_276868 [Daedaleopsis nitida]|nr:hypothetical protein C8Q80DRAFT_276868 [Daedaleopsis nitida]
MKAGVWRHNLDILNSMSENLTHACDRFRLANGVTLETITNRTLSQFHEGLATPVLGRLPRVARARLIAYEEAWQCLPGTCQEVPTDLECWADGTSSSSWGSMLLRVLHLTGGAYTGKTTVAAELCRRLRARKRLGASFFCFGSVDGDDQPGLFFPTIAAELARTYSALYGPIAAAVRHARRQDMLNVQWACTHLFQTPLQTLPQDHPPICIVVDSMYGGDEFSPQWQKLLRQLVACAAKRLSAQTRLRLLLTYRSSSDRHLLQVLDTPDLAHSVHSLSLHAFASHAARDTRAVLVSRMEEHEWSESWVMRNPALVDRLAGDAAGWFPYADAMASWVLEDPRAFDQRVSLLTSETTPMRPTASLLGDLGPLAWPGPLHSRLDKMSSEIQRATRVNGVQTTVASAFIGYIPDIAEPHNMTPRLLGLLTGYPTTKILDALSPYSSVVVSASGRLTAESTVFFLHPLCRASLAVHIVGLATARLCTEPAAMESRLISGCVRLILGCLPDIPLSSPAAVARLAQDALPLAEYDMDDVEYAFAYLREHPVPNQGDIPDCEGLDVPPNKGGIRLDASMLDELYLWLCVLPRMAETHAQHSDPSAS